MTEEFVYLRTGERCRVLHWDEEQVFVAVQVVCEYLWGDEEETLEQDGQILRVPPHCCFDAPPTKVLSEEVKRLEERITALKSAEMGYARVAKEARQKYEEKLVEYARLSDALAKLDQFLCGGITHYFMKPRYASSKPSILMVEETFSSEYYDKDEGRLLSLRPKKGKTLTWALSNTSTGSGSDWECVPCTSYEETLILGQEWIDEQVAAEVYSVTVVDFAREYKLELPKGYISELILKEARDLEKTNRAADTKREEIRTEKKAYWKMLREAGGSGE